MLRAAAFQAGHAGSISVARSELVCPPTGALACDFLTLHARPRAPDRSAAGFIGPTGGLAGPNISAIVRRVSYVVRERAGRCSCPLWVFFLLTMSRSRRPCWASPDKLTTNRLVHATESREQIRPHSSAEMSMLPTRMLMHWPMFTRRLDVDSQQSAGICGPRTVVRSQ